MLLARHGPVDKATPSQELGASILSGGISQAAVVGLIRKSMHSQSFLNHC